MAARYTPEELKLLRDSPLVVKPPNLPPPEQWMGPPAELNRNPNNRGKNTDLHQPNDQSRRPGLERLTSKSTTNPEDIILGPPKTSFMSTRSSSFINKHGDLPERPSLRTNDSKDRFGSYRNEKSDLDLERLREGKGNTSRAPRRGEDEDSDGWNKVKPRKSFGTEGAERFANGRMGVQKEDRRYRERDDRDRDRPRTFENYSRDSKDVKETDDNDRERERENRLSRNGIGRGRVETTWREREANKDKDNDMPSMPRDRNSNGDKFDRDRNRGWREKDKEDGDRERRTVRNDYRDREPRRWGRDQPEEKDPEWNSQPNEGKTKVYTAEDFQKWKEQMHQEKGSGAKAMLATEEDRFKPDAGASFFGLEKEKVETPLSLDTGPDKFFGMWGAKEEANNEAQPEAKLEGPTKAKTTGKASRFTSFFSPQEEPQRQLTEPPPMPASAPPSNGLEALFGRPSVPSAESGIATNSDQEGIQRLLQQLKLQQPSGPRPNILPQTTRPLQEQQLNLPAESPDAYMQYRQDRVEEHRPSTRHQQSAQDMMTQRQLAGSQSSNRQEQVLQELIAQRQNNSSQSSSRADQTRDRNNADFLMGLMQSVRAVPEPQREQLPSRVAPRPNDRQMQQQLLEREQQLEMARDRERAAQSQQQQRRPPPGFYEDPNSFQRSHLPQERQSSGPPPQPTQILQRPPPGLDPSWENRQPPPMQQGSQPQHRMNVPPPPGLQNAPPNRGALPPNVFPPGFPVNNFRPEGMPPGPPRAMMQPPPGFFGGPGHGGPPPPGFLPPGMNGFQGAPDGMGFGPFDGRGPPPPQGFRRNM